MKPKLRKIRGIWRCGLKFIGMGYSPAEAYEDWLKFEELPVTRVGSFGGAAWERGMRVIE